MLLQHTEVDKALSEQQGKIDILKIDCEGSEYPILYTSLCMHSIDNIVGEYLIYKT